MTIFKFSWKKQVEKEKLQNQQEMLDVLYSINENLARHDERLNSVEYRVERIEQKIYK